MVASLLLSSLCFAATFTVPTMREAVWDDRFLYSPEWDTVRVACRGVESPNPVIAGSIENFPLSIRIR